MDFMAQMKAEMERKRKNIAVVQVESDGKKFFKRGDLSAKEDEEYYAKLKRKREERGEQDETESSSLDDAKSDVKTKQTLDDASVFKLGIAEVRKRLRARNLPILLYGEEEKDIRQRLLQHEIEQPDLGEGLKNEMQTAMQDVDNELVKEVIEGTSGDAAKHDVFLPDTDYDWSKIEQRATLLGLGNENARDCDIIFEFFKFILARWGRSLNQRDEEVKKSAAGKYEASIHKQTLMHLKPLLTSLENHNCNHDIRHHLTKICRMLIIDRNYITANNAYMEMAIGNAPWPVGVTRSGIHQRPGSAKSYVSNIAHVLNDETQRKYIQAFKRLMTKMQEYYPTDPSKCVEFVKPL